MFLLTMLNLDCWTVTPDVHGFNGVNHTNVRTLGECQRICINIDSCVAIDWDPNNPYGDPPCWTLTSTATGPTVDKGVVTHYELDRACLDQS